MIHGLVVLALVAGLGPTSPIPAPPAVEVQLFSSARSPRPQGRVASGPRALAPTRRPGVSAELASAPAESSLPGGGPLIALPANPEGAGGLVQGPSLQPGLRRQLGCANAAFLELSKAELDSCAQRLAEGAGRAPQLAVVSAEKRAIFDSDCPPKDEWCLYRTGQGPYPGLFSLLKK